MTATTKKMEALIVVSKRLSFRGKPSTEKENLKRRRSSSDRADVDPFNLMDDESDIIRLPNWRDRDIKKLNYNITVKHQSNDDYDDDTISLPSWRGEMVFKLEKVENVVEIPDWLYSTNSSRRGKRNSIINLRKANKLKKKFIGVAKYSYSNFSFSM
uniref:Uncharacterized protein n=1 Tax=Aplanochytrium stocchinoi TaxID=215587 RepID=A0A7S3PT53_9STRA|mmetsp:Transcript_9714/g.12127  ORF Transcript_9714/g.12127 Transcript_9714/m.12127 type:complete len:157 (+) Transcript_9714:235-705(+)|eukprot:CAMPEP_0204832124 /NCGR_PEP_ID=MMETSP1346-20131115/12802_1 /ASSEMBLY_ACC=CAM_ASM_000771 /TAXON_ID=215587 /ORGANISM="Aplanochytrium stocchinoi, Strain GSBS06" /LENGTH=156 /DNA_ID=CAMNT_0051963757 /DNA_START=152 /DNA_END=622 /DNA_ORIENTATION=-